MQLVIAILGKDKRKKKTKERYTPIILLLSYPIHFLRLKIRRLSGQSVGLIDYSLQRQRGAIS